MKRKLLFGLLLAAFLLGVGPLAVRWPYAVRWPKAGLSAGVINQTGVIRGFQKNKPPKVT